MLSLIGTINFLHWSSYNEKSQQNQIFFNACKKHTDSCTYLNSVGFDLSVKSLWKQIHVHSLPNQQ